MNDEAWYLVVYDISNPRRLQRLHRHIRRQGVAMQKSVFLVQRSPQGIAAYMDELADLIHRHEDDLRAYPVHDPGRIWLRGKGVTEGNLLRPGRTLSESGKSGKTRGWWRRLLGR